MDNVKSEVVNKIQEATNILVTVSTNPSVDQLAACLGLTLWLNKLNKHATAVFSGDIPNALEFLQPEATIEKSTDSLRDFIIALDKSKADKLRYKVEDRVVKIFITPYRASLSSSDLEFSQGDFNVDAIVALGVNKQEDLDNAIVAHGRILHDAVVMTVNLAQSGELGSINWSESTASSLSELVYELGQMLDVQQIDPQISTALLTGIVAETNRFSNNKTTPNTMSIAAALMNAGANQQLVASKLDEAKNQNKHSQDQSLNDDHPADLPSHKELNDAIEAVQTPPVPPPAPPVPPVPAPSQDGLLEITHSEDTARNAPPAAPSNTTSADINNKIAGDGPDYVADVSPSVANEVSSPTNVSSNMIFEPPTMGGTFTANSQLDDGFDPVTDPMSVPNNEPDQLISNNAQISSPAQNDNQTKDSVTKTESVPENSHDSDPDFKPPLSDDAQSNKALPSQDNANQSAASLPPVDYNTGNDLAVASPSATTSRQTLEDLEREVQSPHLTHQDVAVDVDALRDKIADAYKAVPPTDLKPVEALNAVNVDLNSAPDTPQSTTDFKPENFGLDAETDTVDGPPEVPPPIVPPNFLPPQPPSQ